MAWGHNISPEHPNPKTSKTCREAKPTCAGFTWKSRSSCGNRRPVASQISQLKRQKLLKLKRIQKIQKRKELITSNVGFMWGSPRHNHPSYAAIKSNKLQIDSGILGVEARFAGTDGTWSSQPRFRSCPSHRWLGLIGRAAHGPATETGQQQDGVTQHWSLIVADDLQFMDVTIAIGDVYPLAFST